MVSRRAPARSRAEARLGVLSAAERSGRDLEESHRSRKGKSDGQQQSRGKGEIVALKPCWLGVLTAEKTHTYYLQLRELDAQRTAGPVAQRLTERNGL